MICLLVGVYYTMFWPAKLYTACHYRCPYFVSAGKDRAYVPYGSILDPVRQDAIRGEITWVDG
jgi:hypothetical protein